MQTQTTESSDKQPKRQNHRHPRVNGRESMYWHDCPACQADDDARRELKQPQIPDQDLGRTFFLVPDYAPERDIAVMYLKQKYPRAKNIGHEINMQALPYVQGAQVVVVCRRPRPNTELTPIGKLELMKDGKWKEVKTPIAEMVPEVLESAPIGVADSIAVSQPSVFVPSTVSTDELLERLTDVAWGYRVFRQNPPDVMVRLEHI
jgi:hypothetical protein